MQWKTRRKLVLFLTLAETLLASHLTGCTKPPVTPVESAVKPYEGQVLKAACPGEPLIGLLNRHGSSWAKTVGARVEAISYAGADDPAKIADASIWVIRPAELPRLAADDRLHSIPADLRKAGPAFAWQGILPLYREKLLKWSGEVYALPLLGDAPLCFYRADLFGDSRHQKQFQEKYRRELRPPQTWEEFSEIAEYFANHREAGKVVPSLPPLPQSAEELDAHFYAVAVSYDRRAVFQDERKPPSDEELFSFHYNLSTGQPRIDQPGFVHALKLLQNLQAFRPAQASAAPPQAFADGKAVLCLAEPSWIARFRKKLAPAAIGVCPVPGSARWFALRDGAEQPASRTGNHVPYLGSAGWLAVVPKSAPHPQAAFALLADLSSRATGMQIVFNPQWGGGVYRQEHLDADQNWLGFELDAAQTAHLKEALQQTVARPGLMNPVVRLRTPDQREHLQALVEQLKRALTQGADAQEALQAAARRWNELDAAKSLETRKKEYLLSLGLAAVP